MHHEVHVSVSNFDTDRKTGTKYRRDSQNVFTLHQFLGTNGTKILLIHFLIFERWMHNHSGPTNSSFLWIHMSRV